MWSSNYPGLSSMGKMMALALLCTMRTRLTSPGILPRSHKSDSANLQIWRFRQLFNDDRRQPEHWSSIMSSVGRIISALAIANICCSPPETARACVYRKPNGRLTTSKRRSRMHPVLLQKVHEGAHLRQKQA